VPVRQQNRVEPFNLCPQRLLPKIRRRVDDDILPAARK